MPRYAVGIDLSLTSTGLAALDLDTGEMSTAAITSSGKRTDRLPQNIPRLMTLSETIVAGVDQCSPEVVLIESALFNSCRADTSAHRRAGLWWTVALELSKRYRVVEVAPASLKKFVTGKGNADKFAMGIQIAKHFGEQALPDAKADRADASGLAALGGYRLGAPGLPDTAYRDAVMDRVCWSTTQGDVDSCVNTTY